MKRDYNRDVMSDMPVDSSFTPQTQKKTTTRTSTKPKINAIGTQKRTTKSTTASKTTKKSTSSKDTTTGKKEEKLRTKLTNSEDQLNDLEKLNEESIKTYRFKSKRNRVFIILLSVLLAIAIVSIAVVLSISKLKTNCNMFLHGNVEAVFIVDGQELDEFRSPSNLQGNRIFKVNIDIEIQSGGEYNIKFIPKCYQKGVLMENTLIYEHNTTLFKEDTDGYYVSINPIKGGQTINLCGGIILDYYYENSLNVDNFKLDFHVYFEKV